MNWCCRFSFECPVVMGFDLLTQADRELASHGKNPEKLKAAGSFLMKVFGALAVGYSH